MKNPIKITKCIAKHLKIKEQKKTNQKSVPLRLWKSLDKHQYKISEASCARYRKVPEAPWK